MLLLSLSRYVSDAVEDGVVDRLATVVDLRVQHLRLVLALVSHLFDRCLALARILKLVKQLFVDLLHGSSLLMCLFELLTHILDLEFQVGDVLLQLDSLRALDALTLV